MLTHFVRSPVLGSLVKSSLLATTTIMVGAIPCQAKAQESVSGVSLGNEIVVTARRRDEVITRVPIAITAFSADDLAERSIDTTVDLVKVTPGLNINQTATGSPGITIRGQTRGLSGPATPGVQTYFNDIPLDVLSGLIPTYDMANIQVLKGPQGTLFGRNTIGGAILTYSKKPTYELGGYGQVEYGNLDTVRLEAAINIPIVADVLAVRIAGEYYDTDGYTKTYSYTSPTFGQNLLVTSVPMLQPTARNFDEKTSKSFRVSVLFEPVDWLTNETVYSYRKADGINNATFDSIYPSGFGGAPPALYFLPPSVIANLPLGGLEGAVAYNYAQLFSCQNSTFENPCNIVDWAANYAPNGKHIAYANAPLDDTFAKAQSVVNTTTIQLSDNIIFKNIFGWQRTRLSQAVDLDGTPFTVVASQGFSKMDTLTNEAQVAGNLLDGNLDFVLGGFYLKTNPMDPGGFAGSTTRVFGGLSSTLALPFYTSRSEALFAQFDYDLSAILDGVSVTAGYRYTWDKATGCAVNASFFPFIGGPGPSERIPYAPTEAACEAGTVTFPPQAGALSANSHNFSESSSKGTFTLAANWQITPDNLVYVTTRRGYRSGGYNYPFFSGPNNLGIDVSELQTFDPEVVNDIEIGTKNRFSIGSMPATFELAAYRILTSGTQQFLTTSQAEPLPATGLVENYADLKFTGFEAAATIMPTTGLTLGGNVAYIDPKVRNLTIPQALADVFGVYGRSPQAFIFNNISTWQYNFFASFEAPNPVFGGRLLINADYHGQNSSGQGDLIVPGYETVDARVTLKGVGGSPVDVSLFARNIFDEYYYQGAQSSSLTGTGLASYYVAPPRTYGISLRVAFGNE